MGKRFAPSLMTMDLTKFQEQVKFLNDKVNSYHVDIMDGHFVPNITLSPWFIEQLKKISDTPVSAHLMVENPAFWLDQLIELKTDYICCHAETLNGQAYRLAEKIHKAGLCFGVVVNPETSVETIVSYLPYVDKVTIMSVDPGFAGQKFVPETLKKITLLQELKNKNNDYNYEIEIDGSCNAKTYKKIADAGTEIFIVGASGLFSLDSDIKKAWAKMESYFEQATKLADH